jgi:biopolymer transport protein ExbD
MGGAVDTGPAGKSLNYELNLVPFIDLLSTLITFLLATAVWVQMQAMDVEQAIKDPNSPPPETPPDKTPVPPLTVKIEADQVLIFRGDPAKGKEIGVTGSGYDWAAVKAEIQAEHEAYPEEGQVTIFTEDGIAYENMINVLDLTRVAGFDKTLLAGGPAAE